MRGEKKDKTVSQRSTTQWHAILFFLPSILHLSYLTVNELKQLHRHHITTNAVTTGTPSCIVIIAIVIVSTSNITCYDIHHVEAIVMSPL